MQEAPSVLWFNARCSKCRQALDLLRQRGATPELRLYLEQPPTEAELRDLVAAVGGAPLAIVRQKEALFRTLGLNEHSPAAELLRALREHPELIERPIFVRNGRAVVGRPAERVLELLGTEADR